MTRKSLHDVPSLNEKYFPERYGITKMGQVFIYGEAKYDARKISTRRIERYINTSVGILIYVRIHNKSYQIHRLLAEVFLPRAEGKIFVAFKNSNKRDLRSDNLFWGTPKEVLENKIKNDKEHTPQAIKRIKQRAKVRNRKYDAIEDYYYKIRNIMCKRIHDNILPKLNLGRRGSLLIYEIITYRKKVDTLAIEMSLSYSAISNILKRECRRLGIEYDLIFQILGAMGYGQIEKDETFNESI